LGRLNFDQLTVKELRDLEAKVLNAIALARERERKPKWTALAEQYGFTVRELFGGRSECKSTVPKYANPENPSHTWIGRGRRPRWLVAKMRKGAKLQQFAL